MGNRGGMKYEADISKKGQPNKTKRAAQVKHYKIKERLKRLWHRTLNKLEDLSR